MKTIEFTPENTEDFNKMLKNKIFYDNISGYKCQLLHYTDEYIVWKHHVYGKVWQYKAMDFESFKLVFCFSGNCSSEKNY
jgi:hypothetical protein